MNTINDIVALLNERASAYRDIQRSIVDSLGRVSRNEETPEQRSLRDMAQGYFMAADEIESVALEVSER